MCRTIVTRSTNIERNNINVAEFNCAAVFGIPRDGSQTTIASVIIRHSTYWKVYEKAVYSSKPIYCILTSCFDDDAHVSDIITIKGRACSFDTTHTFIKINFYFFRL